MTSNAEEVVVTAAEKLRQEGMAQGMAQGVAQGMAQGQRNMLLKLLHGRFGRVPRRIQKRVQGASLEEIESWTLAVLDAETLDEVFAK